VGVQDVHSDGSVSPLPLWRISGSKVRDLTGAAGTTNNFTNVVQGPLGNPVYISGGRAPAEWTGTASFDCGQGVHTIGYDLQVSAGGLLVPGQCFPNTAAGFFGVSGSTPPSITIQVSGVAFSTASGMPVLNTYSANQQFLKQVSAT
jgi:hypothetical protein